MIDHGGLSIYYFSVLWVLSRNMEADGALCFSPQNSGNTPLAFSCWPSSVVCLTSGSARIPDGPVSCRSRRKSATKKNIVNAIINYSNWLASVSSRGSSELSHRVKDDLNTYHTDTLYKSTKYHFGGLLR
jgi:hypothetical protein